MMVNECVAYLFNDSTNIEKQSANRKTLLTRAPSTSARAQPKVFLLHFFGDIWRQGTVKVKEKTAIEYKGWSCAKMYQ